MPIGPNFLKAFFVDLRYLLWNGRSRCDKLNPRFAFFTAHLDDLHQYSLLKKIKTILPFLFFFRTFIFCAAYGYQYSFGVLHTCFFVKKYATSPPETLLSPIVLFTS